MAYVLNGGREYEKTEISKFAYGFNGKTMVISGYHGHEDMLVVVPDVIEGHEVGGIGFGAFSMCRNMRKIVLPEGIATIESGAFKDCVKLESIELPPGTQTISKNAFRDCTELKRISMPNTVDHIDDYAFQGCVNLTEVEIYDYESGDSRLFTIAHKTDLARTFYIPACLRAMDKKGSYMEKYDATFLEVQDEEDRFEVAAYRLGDPWRLEPTARKIYENALMNQVEHWIRLDNIERLSKIGEYGCIKASSIDYYIDIASRRRGDCTAFLLQYKDEKLTRKEYDFSL